MLRSIKRQIARNRMKVAGIDRINRQRIWDANAGYKHEGKFRSYFSINWRKYLDPDSPQYKWYQQALTRKRRNARYPV